MKQRRTLKPKLFEKVKSNKDSINDKKVYLIKWVQVKVDILI